MSLSNSPVPIPPPASPIDTHNAHSVTVWIKERQKAGTLKRCAHLTMWFFDWLEDSPKGPILNRKVFAPSCEKHSFEWVYKGLTDEQQKNDLEFRLHQNPISCPANCLYYRNKYWARFTILCRRLWTFATLPLSWFSKAAWQTQVSIVGAITLIVVLWLFPQWLPPLIALVKEIRGN
jgi:hypothetical protein